MLDHWQTCQRHFARTLGVSDRQRSSAPWRAPRNFPSRSNSDHFSGGADELCQRHRYIADSRADVQYALPCTDSRLLEKSLGDGGKARSLPNETFMLVVSQKVVRARLMLSHVPTLAPDRRRPVSSRTHLGLTSTSSFNLHLGQV